MATTTETPHARSAREKIAYLPKRLPSKPPHTTMKGGDQQRGGKHLGLGHAGRTRMVACLVVFLSLALAFSSVLPPLVAKASTVTFSNGKTATLHDDTGKITGKATVTFSYTHGIGDTGFKVKMPDGQTLKGKCISTGHVIPANGTYSFTATPKRDGTYSVVVNSSTASKKHPRSAASDIWPAQKIGKMSWKPRMSGNLRIQKTSTNPAITKNNHCYTLKGAVYVLYSDTAHSHEVTRLTTDEKGVATSGALKAGTYYLIESQASTGYARDTTSYTARISAGKTTTVDVHESPQYDTPSVLLTKIDADTGKATPQGSASLAGASYKVYYYDGYYTRKTLPQQAVRSWTFKTGSDGRILLDKDHLISGTLYTTTGGSPVLPLGTYTFEESKAPVGYLPSSTSLSIAHVTAQGTNDRVTTYVAPTDKEHVIHGGLIIQKRDTETGGTHPLASGSFEGITIVVTNTSKHAVSVHDTSFAPGTSCATIVLDAQGTGKLAADTLPFGHYTLREEVSGRGYLTDTEWSQEFDIKQDGQIVDYTKEDASLKDQIKRGDLTFTKYEADSGKPMAHIPFLLRSRTTGEAHVLVTNDDGVLATTTSFIPHTTKTNANDEYVTRADDGTWQVDESKLDPSVGVWFGTGTYDDGSIASTTAQNQLGALPYDRVEDNGGYVLSELPCSANQGRRLIETTLSITDNETVLDLGHIDNMLIDVATTLTTSQGTHLISAGTHDTFSDVIAYSGLLPGEHYHLTGELHIVDASGTDKGILTQSQADFVADTEEGSTSLTFDVDTTGLEGKKLVAFETLTDIHGSKATHADLDDEKQTVSIPSLATRATGKTTKTHDAAALVGPGVVDVISYQGLLPAQGYHLEASLHLVGTDGADEGTIAETHTDFDAESPTGTVTLWFEDLDLTAYAGRTLVVYDYLSKDGVIYAAHDDPTDADQRVLLPSINTSASSSRAQGVIAAADHETIVDTVTYTNLLPHTTYQLTATVHLLSASGKEVHDAGVVGHPSTLSFTTAEAAEGTAAVSGTAEVSIPLSLSSYAGSTFVVCEELTRDGITVASHTDLNDSRQTISVPALHTIASCEGTHEALAGPQQTLNDEVRYEHLVPNQTYTLEARLIGISEATGESKELASQKISFTPEHSEGTLDVSFKGIDCSGYDGGSLVVFERLFYDDLVVVAHEDPHDEYQTVHLPGLYTEATGATDTHTVFAGADQTITDHISYTNLLPEQTYSTTATLHVVKKLPDGRVADGGAISDPVVVEFTTPASKNGAATVSGEVEIPITTYLVDRIGSDIVCFEELRAGKRVLAIHNDPSDEGQTVHIPSLGTRAESAPANKQGVIEIVDHIDYRNLTPGETYDIVGTLHQRKHDGSDAGVVKTESGDPLTERRVFVAEQAQGTFDVSFTINPTSLGLAGSDLVVFEGLYQADILVARHEDIKSASQTISFTKDGQPAHAKAMPQTGRSALPQLAVLLGVLLIAGGTTLSLRRYH